MCLRACSVKLFLVEKSKIVKNGSLNKHITFCQTKESKQQDNTVIIKHIYAQGRVQGKLYGKVVIASGRCHILKKIAIPKIDLVHSNLHMAVMDLRSGQEPPTPPPTFEIYIKNLLKVPLDDVGSLRPDIMVPPKWIFCIRHCIVRVDEIFMNRCNSDVIGHIKSHTRARTHTHTHTHTHTLFTYILHLNAEIKIFTIAFSVSPTMDGDGSGKTIVHCSPSPRAV